MLLDHAIIGHSEMLQEEAEDLNQQGFIPDNPNAPVTSTRCRQFPLSRGERAGVRASVYPCSRP